MSNSPYYLSLCSFFIQIPFKFRCLKFFIVQLFPVDALKPRIIFERHKGWSSQTTFWLIFVQKLLHQLSGLFIFQRPGVLQLQVKNLLVNLQWILTLFSKRNIPAHKFKHIYTQGIQADCECISFSNNYLRCHIVRSTNESVSFGSHNVSPFYHFSSNKIYQFNVALQINHKVFRLKIAHDNALCAEVLKYQNHRSYIELSILSAQQSYLSDSVVQLFSLNELNQRVEIVLVFKAFVVLHDKRVIQGSQQIFLLRNVLEKRMLFNFLLAVALKHIQLLFLQLVQAAYQQDWSEFALFEFLQNYKLVQPINKFVPLFDLLMKLLSLPFLVLFNHCIHKPAYYLLDDVCLYLSNHAIRLHNYIILVSCLCFVLQQELFTVDLRADSNRIDVFVFLQSSLDHDYQLLVVHVLGVLFNDHVA